MPTRRVVPTMKIMAKDLENLINVTTNIENIVSEQKKEEKRMNEKAAVTVSCKQHL